MTDSHEPMREALHSVLRLAQSAMGPQPTLNEYSELMREIRDLTEKALTPGANPEQTYSWIEAGFTREGEWVERTVPPVK